LGDIQVKLSRLLQYMCKENQKNIFAADVSHLDQYAHLMTKPKKMSTKAVG